MPNPESSKTPAAPTSPPITAVPTVCSGELLGKQGTLQIDHKGSIYTLRSTSKGGLILTK